MANSSLSKPELREAYALAILLKKYWAGFIKEHVYGESSGLSAAGYHPNPASDQIMIKELIIYFLWVLSNTHVEAEREEELGMKLLEAAHNVYLNGDNPERLLQEVHTEQFGYADDNSLPQVEMGRLISRYRQYDKALNHELEEDPFAIYQRIVYNMLPIGEFGFLVELFYYAALQQFTDALRVDYRNFVAGSFRRLNA